MMAIFKPLRDAAADSLGLNGASRETYYSETADALKALFNVYPDAGLAVIHVVLDPITDKYGSRVNAAGVPSPDRPMPSVQPTISTRSARARDALTMGADAYKLGSALKNRAQLQHAVDLLVESDELEPSDDAKFLVAGSAYQIGEIAARQAQSTGSCDLSTLASESFTKARTYLQFGVAGHPEATRQLMEGISQFAPTLSEQKKRFCRQSAASHCSSNFLARF